MTADHQRDGGTLRIMLIRPFGSKLDVLYEESSPRLLIDGEEQVTDGWGEVRFELAPGRHQLRVCVPIESVELGLVEREVTVATDTETVLQYCPPGLPPVTASLRTPAEEAEANRMDDAILTRFAVVLGLLVLAYVVYRFA